MDPSLIEAINLLIINEDLKELTNKVNGIDKLEDLIKKSSVE